MPPSVPSHSPTSHLASVRENGSKQIDEAIDKNGRPTRNTATATSTATGTYSGLGNPTNQQTSTQQQQQDAGASHLPLNAPASNTALDPYNSLYGSNNMSYGGGGGMGGMYGGGGGGMYGGSGMGMGGGMGMGMGGMGMGGGMGMMGSPYGMSPMMGGMGGSLSNLNQFLFGIQNVLSSLGQAVQIVGMNTQAVKQLLEAASGMFDHAVATWSEMRAIEAAASDFESEEDKKRRRRLRALRWAMVTAATYAGYKCLKWLFSSSRKRHQRPMLEGQQSSAMSGYRPYSSDPYGGSGNYGSSPYGGGYSSYGSGQGYGY
jgi:hypothetical protein